MNDKDWPSVVISHQPNAITYWPIQSIFTNLFEEVGRIQITFDCSIIGQPHLGHASARVTHLGTVPARPMSDHSWQSKSFVMMHDMLQLYHRQRIDHVSWMNATVTNV